MPISVPGGTPSMRTVAPFSASRRAVSASSCTAYGSAICFGGDAVGLWAPTTLVKGRPLCWRGRENKAQMKVQLRSGGAFSRRECCLSREIEENRHALKSRRMWCLAIIVQAHWLASQSSCLLFDQEACRLRGSLAQQEGLCETRSSHLPAPFLRDVVLLGDPSHAARRQPNLRARPSLQPVLSLLTRAGCGRRQHQPRRRRLL